MANDQQTEEEIVRGLRSGSRDAWTALCELYSERVWRYVAKLIGHSESAVADVYQETMLAVARGGRGLRVNTSLWPWLAGIAHNQVALYWRKQYRDHTRREPNSPVDLLKTDADPAAAIQLEEQSASVRCVLSQMNSQDAMVLVAKYVDGASLQEIASQCGGTVQAVSSRLARARRDFRQRFERISLK